MNNELPNDTTVASLDRRGLLRIGGLTAVSAVVVAACGKTEAGTVGRVGEGGQTPVLADAIVNDGVLLRTMAGIETSIAAAYGHILEGGFLSKASATLPDLGDQSELVAIFQAHHVVAAETFNALAVEAGAEPWLCGNTRLDDAYITPIFERIEQGIPATDTTLKIEPSDDPTRDYVSMQIGVRSARQAALIALRIFPGGYVAGVGESVVAETDATTTTAAEGAAPAATAIPLPFALPARFGLLSPTTFIGGAGDENGVRLKFNFETPSLNSLAYPFYSCP